MERRKGVPRNRVDKDEQTQHADMRVNPDGVSWTDEEQVQSSRLGAAAIEGFNWAEWRRRQALVSGGEDGVVEGE